MEPCDHLQQFKQDGGVKTYEKFLIHLCIILTPHLKKTRDKLGIKTKGNIDCAAVEKCLHKYGIWGEMYSCLHCIYFGCKFHCQDHFIRNISHPIACTISEGFLYCFSCDDYKRDSVMDGLRDLVHHGRNSCIVKANLIPFTDNARDIIPSALCLDSRSTIGLRGLVNLKNTCYMSCIIQVLTHTPILADFFLSDCYDLDCEEIHSDSKPCLMACMTDIFRQFYNGEKIPILLTDLLMKMWLNAPHLASADQQDAHEFLTAILEGMGLHFSSIKSPCIIQEIFHGTLKSTVQCLKCRSLSVTEEPFMEISLEVFGNSEISLEDCLLRYTQVEELSHTIDCGACKEKQESSKQLELVHVPLILCLHFKRFQSLNHNKWIHHVRFSTRINLLLYSSSRAEFQLKGQMSVNGNNHNRPQKQILEAKKKLVKVNVEMTATTATSAIPCGSKSQPTQQQRQKSDNDRQGPRRQSTALNVSSHQKRTRVDFKTGLGSHFYQPIKRQSVNINDDFEYSLYAVVSHKGSSEGGHYIAYFRNIHDAWFLCDDHIITKASLDQVLGCQAYMLFYHRTSLPHRPEKSNSDSS